MNKAIYYSGLKMSAEEFNKAFRIGTPVTYHPIIGNTAGVDTRTRSHAWELPSGHTVVLVEGRTGGVSVAALTLKGG